MKVQKFLHSCLLLEESGQKLLIDPGSFSFIEKKVIPNEIGPVDVVLITHDHSDHYDLKVMNTFLKSSTRIFSTKNVKKKCAEAGITTEIIQHGEEKVIGNFTIKAIDIKHEGPLIEPIPENVGFLINKKIFHPGDSISYPKIDCEVLALPIEGPWLNRREALDAVITLKPRIVIPIHDARLKDFALNTTYNVSMEYLAKSGIEFHPLELNKTLEI